MYRGKTVTQRRPRALWCSSPRRGRDPLEISMGSRWNRDRPRLSCHWPRPPAQGSSRAVVESSQRQLFDPRVTLEWATRVGKPRSQVSGPGFSTGRGEERDDVEELTSASDSGVDSSPFFVNTPSGPITVPLEALGAFQSFKEDVDRGILFPVPRRLLSQENRIV